ncbi:uncharacterized protein LOC133330511 [Musca vetustissima]|uniref:uncharacterized protein LOC133330511 n=1 Tax=Musca vetustissima TaxID=27455 RepID=UPI002AB6BEF4|nr:uncharacterized protein LOC133330511 [Musca vetustissima]
MNSSSASDNVTSNVATTTTTDSQTVVLSAASSSNDGGNGMPKMSNAREILNNDVEMPKGGRRLIRTIRPIDVRKLQQSGLDRKIAEVLSKQKKLGNGNTTTTITKTTTGTTPKPLINTSSSSSTTNNNTLNVPSIPKNNVKPHGSTTTAPTSGGVGSTTASTSASASSAPPPSSSSTPTPYILNPTTRMPDKNSLTLSGQKSIIIKPIIPPKITITAPEATSPSLEMAPKLPTANDVAVAAAAEQRMKHVKSLLHQKLMQRQQNSATPPGLQSSPSPPSFFINEKGQKQYAHLKPPANETTSPPPIILNKSKSNRQTSDGSPRDQQQQKLPTKIFIHNSNSTHLLKPQRGGGGAGGLNSPLQTKPYNMSPHGHHHLPGNQWGGSTPNLYQKSANHGGGTFSPIVGESAKSASNQYESGYYRQSQGNMPVANFHQQLPIRPQQSYQQQPQWTSGGVTFQDNRNQTSSPYYHLPTSTHNMANPTLHKAMSYPSLNQMANYAINNAINNSNTEKYNPPTMMSSMPMESSNHPQTLPTNHRLINALNINNKNLLQSPYGGGVNKNSAAEPSTPNTPKLPTKPKTPQKSPQDIARKLDFDNQQTPIRIPQYNPPGNLNADNGGEIPPKASVKPLQGHVAIVKQTEASTPPGRNRIVIPDVSPLKTPFPTANLPQEAPLPTIDTFKKPYPTNHNYFQLNTGHISISYPSSSTTTTITALPEPQQQHQPENNLITIPSSSSPPNQMAPNSLIVLENKVLSQDEMIDLTALRLSTTSNTNQRFARPHKPIPEVVIKQENPDDTETTNTPANEDAAAAVEQKPSPIIQTQSNQRGMVLISSRQNKKIIVNASKLQLPPEKIADLAKIIAQKAVNKSSGGGSGGTIQNLKSPGGGGGVFSQSPSKQQNKNLAGQKVYLIVKKDTGQQASALEQKPNKSSADIASNLSTTSQQSTKEPPPMLEIKKEIPPPTKLSYTPTKYLKPAVEIIDEPSDDDDDGDGDADGGGEQNNFSAVDFIASLAQSNPITEETQLELSPEELNLNASCAMNLSPLRIPPPSPQRRRTFSSSSVSQFTIPGAENVQSHRVRKNSAMDIGKIVTMPQYPHAPDDADSSTIPMVDTIIIESSKGRDVLRKSVDGEILKAAKYQEDLWSYHNREPLAESPKLSPRKSLTTGNSTPKESKERLPQIKIVSPSKLSPIKKLSASQLMDLNFRELPRHEGNFNGNLHEPVQQIFNNITSQNSFSNHSIMPTNTPAMDSWAKGEICQIPGYLKDLSVTRVRTISKDQEQLRNVSSQHNTPNTRAEKMNQEPYSNLSTEPLVSRGVEITISRDMEMADHMKGVRMPITNQQQQFRDIVETSVIPIRDKIASQKSEAEVSDPHKEEKIVTKNQQQLRNISMDIETTPGPKKTPQKIASSKDPHNPENISRTSSMRTSEPSEENMIISRDQERIFVPIEGATGTSEPNKQAQATTSMEQHKIGNIPEFMGTSKAKKQGETTSSDHNKEEQIISNESQSKASLLPKEESSTTESSHQKKKDLKSILKVTTTTEAAAETTGPKAGDFLPGDDISNSSSSDGSVKQTTTCQIINPNQDEQMSSKANETVNPTPVVSKRISRFKKGKINLVQRNKPAGGGRGAAAAGGGKSQKDATAPPSSQDKKRQEGILSADSLKKNAEAIEIIEGSTDITGEGNTTTISSSSPKKIEEKENERETNKNASNTEKIVTSKREENTESQNEMVESCYSVSVGAVEDNEIQVCEITREENEESTAPPPPSGESTSSPLDSKEISKETMDKASGQSEQEDKGEQLSHQSAEEVRAAKSSQEMPQDVTEQQLAGGSISLFEVTTLSRDKRPKIDTPIEERPHDDSQIIAPTMEEVKSQDDQQQSQPEEGSSSLFDAATLSQDSHSTTETFMKETEVIAPRSTTFQNNEISMKGREEVPSSSSNLHEEPSANSKVSNEMKLIEKGLQMPLQGSATSDELEGIVIPTTTNLMESITNDQVGLATEPNTSSDCNFFSTNLKESHKSFATPTPSQGSQSHPPLNTMKSSPESFENSAAEPLLNTTEKIMDGSTTIAEHNSTKPQKENQSTFEETIDTPANAEGESSPMDSTLKPLENIKATECLEVITKPEAVKMTPACPKENNFNEDICPSSQEVSVESNAGQITTSTVEQSSLDKNTSAVEPSAQEIAEVSLDHNSSQIPEKNLTSGPGCCVPKKICNENLTAMDCGVAKISNEFSKETPSGSAVKETSQENRSSLYAGTTTIDGDVGREVMDMETTNKPESYLQKETLGEDNHVSESMDCRVIKSKDGYCLQSETPEEDNNNCCSKATGIREAHAKPSQNFLEENHSHHLENLSSRSQTSEELPEISSSEQTEKSVEDSAEGQIREPSNEFVMNKSLQETHSKSMDFDALKPSKTTSNETPMSLPENPTKDIMENSTPGSSSSISKVSSETSKSSNRRDGKNKSLQETSQTPATHNPLSKEFEDKTFEDRPETSKETSPSCNNSPDNIPKSSKTKEMTENPLDASPKSLPLPKELQKAQVSLIDIVKNPPPIEKIPTVPKIPFKRPPPTSTRDRLEQIRGIRNLLNKIKKPEEKQPTGSATENHHHDDDDDGGQEKKPKEQQPQHQPHSIINVKKLSELTEEVSTDSDSPAQSRDNTTTVSDGVTEVATLPSPIGRRRSTRLGVFNSHEEPKEDRVIKSAKNQNLPLGVGSPLPPPPDDSPTKDKENHQLPKVTRKTRRSTSKAAENPNQSKDSKVRQGEDGIDDLQKGNNVIATARRTRHSSTKAVENLGEVAQQQTKESRVREKEEDEVSPAKNKENLRSRRTRYSSSKAAEKLTNVPTEQQQTKESKVSKEDEDHLQNKRTRYASKQQLEDPQSLFDKLKAPSSSSRHLKRNHLSSENPSSSMDISGADSCQDSQTEYTRPASTSPRKRLRKTLEDIKKSHKNPTSDSEDEVRDFEAIANGYVDQDDEDSAGGGDHDPSPSDFLGFEDNSMGSHKCKTPDIAGEGDVQNSSPTKASTTKGGTLKNWLTTGKAISPTSHSKQSMATRQRHRSMPLKKRWELNEKSCRDETDITDDSTPVNDDEEEEEEADEVRETSKRPLKTVIDSSKNLPDTKRRKRDNDRLEVPATTKVCPEPISTLISKKIDINKISETDSDTPVTMSKRSKRPRRRLISDDFDNQTKNTPAEPEEKRTGTRSQKNATKEETRSQDEVNETSANVEENPADLLTSITSKRKRIKKQDDAEDTPTTTTSSRSARQNKTREEEKPRDETYLPPPADSVTPNAPEVSKSVEIHEELLTPMASKRRRIKNPKFDDDTPTTTTSSRLRQNKKEPEEAAPPTPIIPPQTIENLNAEQSESDFATPKPKGKRGRKKKIPNELDAAQTPETPITNIESYSALTPASGSRTMTKEKIIENQFNPRLLLITKREQLNSDTVLTHDSRSSAGPIQCGLCLQRITEAKWIMHLSQHYGVGWKMGEPEVDISNRSTVLSVIINFLRDTEIKGLACRICNRLYRSGLGLLTHIENCGGEAQRADCEYCHRNYALSTLNIHLRSCPERYKQLKQNEAMSETNDEASQGEQEQVLSVTGRAKRHSTIKAETKIKKLGAEISNSVDEKGDFNPQNHIRHTAVLGEEVREKWRDDIKKFAKAFCPGKMCQYTSDKIEQLEEHIPNCRFLPKSGYYCTMCKRSKCFVTEKEAISHVNTTHRTKEDFSLSDSDCNIKTDDEQSSDDDLLSDAVEEDENELNDVDEEASEEEVKSTTATKKKKSRKSRPNTRPMPTGGIYRKRVFDKRSRDGTNKIILDKWLNFTNLNYTTNPLFANFKPHYSLLENGEWEKYLPQQSRSMKFAMSKEKKLSTTIGLNTGRNEDWQQIERFQNFQHEAESFCFAGAPIVSSSWVPLPNDVREQYLLIAYRRDMFKFTKYQNPKRVKTTLVLFKVNQTKVQGSKRRIPQIKLHYVIAIADGPVYNVAFLPSGGYSVPENRLALVAVATAGSNINIYSLPIEVVPQSEEISNVIPIIEPKPCFELMLDIISQDNNPQDHVLMNTQCLQIVWSEYSGHNHIFASYSNGCMAMWDISDDAQENLNRFEVNGLIQYAPINYFYVGEKGIRYFAIHYDSLGPRWLALNCFCRKFIIYDIRNVSLPIPLKEDYAKNVVRGLEWCPLWEPIMVAYCDSIPNNGRAVLLINPTNIMAQQQKLDFVVSAVTAIHYNPWINLCIESVDNGDLVFMDCREIHYEHVLGRKFGERRILSSMDIRQLNGKPLQRLTDIKENEKSEMEWSMYDQDYKEKYGVVFQPMIKLKESLKDSYLNENRRAPINITPYMRINTVRCNLNKGGKNLVAVGYENGFLRIINFDKDSQFRDW